MIRKRLTKPINVVFYASDKPRELMLAEALGISVRSAGDTFSIRRTGDYGETDEGEYRKFPGPTADTDVAVFFGVKGASKLIMDEHLAAGKSTLFMDKGYSRAGGEGGHTEYSRISVNGSNPLEYMMRTKRPEDRWDQLPERRGMSKGRTGVKGGAILFCGSSAKYHTFHNLEDPTLYADRIVKRLRKLTERHIIYRPKPSWKGAVPISGTSFSQGTCSIKDALRSCHCIVTHGSAAAMDAILAGVPAIVLGGAVTRPVSEIVLENVENPFWPDDEWRLRWCHAMAYCQWTTGELRSGWAWSELRKELILQSETDYVPCSDPPRKPQETKAPTQKGDPSIPTKKGKK